MSLFETGEAIYQPYINLTNGKIHWFEGVLLLFPRWHNTNFRTICFTAIRKFEFRECLINLNRSGSQNSEIHVPRYVTVAEKTVASGTKYIDEKP